MIIVEKQQNRYITLQKTLSKQEFYILIEKYQKTHDPIVKEELLVGNMRLVLSLMKRFYQKSKHYEDLFQVGMIGLIKAIDNFDTAINYNFNLCRSFDSW